jgi:hypothetical protein
LKFFLGEMPEVMYILSQEKISGGISGKKASLFPVFSQIAQPCICDNPDNSPALMERTVWTAVRL